MDKIKITKELRDYIELLHYEQVRYNDFMRVIHRDIVPMTDEEWESSLEYFRTLTQDANMSYQAIIESINELYQNEINGRDWFVDFLDCSIKFPPDKPLNETTDNSEQYGDYINRLYPLPEELRKDSVGIKGYGVRSITMQVTDGCNMKCTYCYQHNKGNHTMTFDTAKRFIDMLLDCDDRVNKYLNKNSNGVIIDFIGGEPWLEIDLITQISDYFIGELFRRKHQWAIKFMLSACSNGLLHFDKRVQKYLTRHKGHFSYNVSIDGDKELHDSCRIDLSGNGTYDRAIAAVYHYTDTIGGKMGSKMTISPENVSRVGVAVKDMIAKGYTAINLNCIFEEGWTNEHARELYWQLHDLTDWVCEQELQNKVSFSILKENACQPNSEDNNKNWCGGTGSMLAIDYKGDIFPCLRYMESSVGDKVQPYIIGNLEKGICNTPEHCERVECMECVTRRSQSTDECWNCPISMGCGWCSAYNYEVFGTVNKRTTFTCCMHKARSLATYYYQHKIGNTKFKLYCPKEWAIEIIGEEEYNNLLNME